MSNKPCPKCGKVHPLCSNVDCVRYGLPMTAHAGWSWSGTRKALRWRCPKCGRTSIVGGEGRYGGGD